MDYIIQREEERNNKAIIDNIASEFIDYLAENFEYEANEEKVNEWLNERYELIKQATGDKADRTIKEFKENLAYL